MPKRPPKKRSEPDDIFDDRFENAMALATAPSDQLAAAESPLPTPQSEAKETHPTPSKVVSMPRAQTQPQQAPETPEIAPEAAKSRKTSKAADSPTSAPQAAISAFEGNDTLKLRVPISMRHDYKRFAAEFGSELGVTVDDSNVARPLLEWFLAEQAPRILEAAKAERGNLKRPANGDAVGMAEFDEALGRIFESARKRKRRAPASEPNDD